MYNVSQAFHDAVRDGARQKAMLIFKDCVFTDEDISVEEGIQFREHFCTSEDLAIGQANSNELSFSLFNDDRLLNNYKFGDFLATIGVLVATDTYTQKGSVYVRTQNNAEYVGSDTAPTLTRNGVAVSSQPNFAVKCLIAYDGKVYAFGASRQYAVYDDSDGSRLDNVSVSNFMRTKVKKWEGLGAFYNKSSRRLLIYRGGDREVYEFCPLGYFVAERPNTPDVIQIDMICYDWMQKFDVDMPKLNYPCTIGDLFKQLCNKAGLQPATTSFINSGARISAEPEDFDTATMRDVLKWIAEAAGANARITRDGKVELTWLRNTNQRYEATNYSEFQPYWYETKKVTRLVNRESRTGNDYVRGSGTEGYLIQDNPLLKGVV